MTAPLAVMAPRGALSPTARGILLMLATMAFFVAADTTAKVLTQTYPAAQIVWGRFAFNFLIVAVCVGPGLLRAFRTRRPLLQLARSVLQVGSTASFFGALFFLPIATAITLAFLQPLLITALSVPLLGERVGPRRWAAIGCGFLGVMIIMRPGAAMEWAALLPLATAAFSALYQLATRAVAAVDPVMTTLFYTAALGTLLSSAAVPFFWQAPDLAGWCLLAMVGLLSGVGHLLMIRAYALASASLLAPFTYTQLVWATLFGFLVFGDVPDGWTAGGAAVIVGSGLYVFHRERRLAAR